MNLIEIPQWLFTQFMSLEHHPTLELLSVFQHTTLIFSRLVRKQE